MIVFVFNANYDYPVVSLRSVQTLAQSKVVSEDQYGGRSRVCKIRNCAFPPYADTGGHHGARSALNFGITLSANRRRLSREP
jgi:hypothetical protein